MEEKSIYYSAHSAHISLLKLKAHTGTIRLNPVFVLRVQNIIFFRSDNTIMPYIYLSVSFISYLLIMHFIYDMLL